MGFKDRVKGMIGRTPTTDSSFGDGISSLYNSVVNQRNALSSNGFTHERVNYTELEAMYLSGIGNKIVNIKADNALNDTLQFETPQDEEFFKTRLHQAVKDATKFKLAFGRGIILINEIGADLSTKAPEKLTLNNVKFDVFSGDMLTAMDVDRNLSSRRYLKPKSYQVRGHLFHHSRVIDFTYIRPIEVTAPSYQYGGVSEFEMIKNKLFCD